ncbi:VOC family protein [Puerhibacterium sp. TATVAM-FAB25]|uniref:VOC family protein n=1 Tax=Puerhibacterium sp. TATVAM-FAB25 TaxID=3093699 RepID=UPI00397AA9A3
MDDRIDPADLERADGAGDWRCVAGAAVAVFRTGTFDVGARLVARVAALADAADHHPDVDLRYAAVTVRLVSHDVGGLSRRDLALAREVSAAARELGVAADPAGASAVEVCVDALQGAAVRPFWAALLGYAAERGRGAVPALADPLGRGPRLRFAPADAPRTERGRLRLDVHVPADAAEPRVAAALAAGGHLVTGRRAPGEWVLADPEGNEARVRTWQRPDGG